MRLGKERASRLSAALSAVYIDLPVEKAWSFWKRNGRNVNVAEIDPLTIAESLRHAFQEGLMAG